LAFFTFPTFLCGEHLFIGYPFSARCSLPRFPFHTRRPIYRKFSPRSPRPRFFRKSNAQILLKPDHLILLPQAFLLPSPLQSPLPQGASDLNSLRPQMVRSLYFQPPSCESLLSFSEDKDGLHPSSFLARAAPSRDPFVRSQPSNRGWRGPSFPNSPAYYPLNNVFPSSFPLWLLNSLPYKFLI